jgi:hypothetical protein
VWEIRAPMRPAPMMPTCAAAESSAQRNLMCCCWCGACFGHKLFTSICMGRHLNAIVDTFLCGCPHQE